MKGKARSAKKQTARSAVSTRSQKASSGWKTTKPKVEGLAKSEEPFAAHCEELSSDDSSIESIEINPEESRQQMGSFLAGRKDQFILLVYPFTGDEKDIEAASDGLNEASGATRAGVHPQQSEASGTDRDTMDDYKKPEATKVCLRQRAHYVTVRVEDFKRLEPTEWLNDSLVDFWMQW